MLKAGGCVADQRQEFKATTGKLTPAWREGVAREGKRQFQTQRMASAKGQKDDKWECLLKENKNYHHD